MPKYDHIDKIVISLEEPTNKLSGWLLPLRESKRFMLLFYDEIRAKWMPTKVVWEDVICKPEWVEKMDRVFKKDENGNIVVNENGVPIVDPAILGEEFKIDMFADDIRYTYSGGSEIVKSWRNGDPKNYPDVIESISTWVLGDNSMMDRDDVGIPVFEVSKITGYLNYYANSNTDFGDNNFSVLRSQLYNGTGGGALATYMNGKIGSDYKFVVKQDGKYYLYEMNSGDNYNRLYARGEVTTGSRDVVSPVFSLDYIVERLLYLIEQCDCIKRHMNDSITFNTDDMSEYALKSELQTIQNQLNEILTEVQTLRANVNSNTNKIYSLESDDSILKKYYLATKNGESNFNDISSQYQNLLIKRAGSTSNKPYTAYLTQNNSDSTTYYFAPVKIPQFYNASNYNTYINSGRDEDLINEDFNKAAISVTSDTVTGVVDVTDSEWEDLMSFRDHVIGEYDSSSGFQPNVDDLPSSGLNFGDGHGGYDVNKKYIAKNGNNYALVTISEASADIDALDDLYSGYIVFVQLLERKTVGKKDVLVILDKDGNSHFIG